MGQAQQPARNTPDTQARGKVIGEMATVPPEEVVVISRVVLNELVDDLGDVGRSAVRVAQVDIVFR